MQDTGRVATILFADICGSTPLYERSGNRSALKLIAATLDAMELVVHRNGGRTVRSKGDDLLCTFDAPVDALDAASDILAAVSNPQAPIRMGMHYGTVIEARGDIFGDAVNTAARMLQLAKPGEMLTTETLIAMLPEDQRDRLTLLGGRTVKGKAQPIQIYSLLHDAGERTEFVRSDTIAEREKRAEQDCLVILEYGDQRWIHRAADGALRIGRSDRCEVIVNEKTVSREHATLQIAAGRVILTDHSTSGSWICEMDGTTTPIKREAAVLSGAGIICVGTQPSSRQDTTRLRYSVHGTPAARDPRATAPRMQGELLDTRSVERVPISPPAAALVLCDGEHAIEAYIADLSSRGACLTAEQPLGRMHDELEMHVLDGTIAMRCMVRYQEPFGPSTSRWVQGVLFTEVAPEARSFIQRVLDDHALA